jgi:hypothetical protein
MVGGGLSFFSFSSVCCQLSWRAVVCGRILFFYIGFSWLYSGTICGFVFYKLLILSYLLQMVEEEYGPGSLWAFAGANAVGASPAGYRDSHWGVGVRCAGFEGQPRYVGGWRQEGRNLLRDLRLGQSDLPAEVWAGYCEQPAVCLWLEGSFFGVEWRVCVIQIMACLFCHLFFIGLFLLCCKVPGFAWYFCVDYVAVIFVFNKVASFFLASFFSIFCFFGWDFGTLFLFSFWILFSLWFAFKCEMVEFLIRV